MSLIVIKSKHCSSEAYQLAYSYSALIQFRWSRASEQTGPFELSDASSKTKKELSKISFSPVISIESKITGDPSANIEAVGNYWFELVTDTVSMSNLSSDTTLTDTTKTVSSLVNSTNYYWRVKASDGSHWKMRFTN